MNQRFSFAISSQHGSARTGLLSCPHGVIRTPAFVFCATKASLKCVHPSTARALGTDVILANTYHLMINKGADMMRQAGGIHKFMGWDGPMFTDSGGFQIFSLGHGSVADEIKRRNDNARNKSLLKITADGAWFRSHIDGAKYYLTPEKSMQVQRDIGADFAFVLDECTPFHVDKQYTEQSMYKSHAWERRSLAAFNELNHDSAQALYGIVQGGIHMDLRRISTDFVMEQGFFGVGIGGSLGSSKEQMYDVVNQTCAMLEPSRPRHLLGIGSVRDILTLVKSGIDTFDCVHPTRIARHGAAILRHSVGGSNKETIPLLNSKFRDDLLPLDKDCQCTACRTISRSYIHYLLKNDDPLAMILLTQHNIQQMNNLMADVRRGISEGSLRDVEGDWLP